MTTDSDSECSYVANLAGFNVIIVILKVIVIKVVYNSHYSKHSNSNKIIVITSLFTQPLHSLIPYVY